MNNKKNAWSDKDLATLRTAMKEGKGSTEIAALFPKMKVTRVMNKITNERKKDLKTGKNIAAAARKVNHAAKVGLTAAVREGVFVSLEDFQKLQKHFSQERVTVTFTQIPA